MTQSKTPGAPSAPTVDVVDPESPGDAGRDTGESSRVDGGSTTGTHGGSPTREQPLDDPVVRITRTGVDYEIRRYRESDLDDAVALKQLVWKQPTTRASFRRLYPTDPDLGHVPIFVAATAEGVVGMAPTKPYRVVVDGTPVLGLLTVDTTVHPDHQRRGLFTAMLEAELAYYEARGVRLLFSHSNANSRPGYRKQGWRYLGAPVRHYRIRDPGAFLAKKARPAIRRLAPALRPVLGIHQGLCDRVGRRVTGTPGFDGELRRVEGIATAELVELYRRQVPARPHVAVDNAFFASYLDDTVESLGGDDEGDTALAASDRRRDETYLAVDADGEPVAGVLAHTVDHGHVVLTSVSAVFPLDGDAEWRGALAALLARLVADHPETAVFRLDDHTVPDAVCRATGFVADDRWPLSAAVKRHLQLGVRPLGNGPDDADPDAAPMLNGVSLADARALWNAH